MAYMQGTLAVVEWQKDRGKKTRSSVGKARTAGGEEASVQGCGSLRVSVHTGFQIWSLVMLVKWMRKYRPKIVQLLFHMGRHVNWVTKCRRYHICWFRFVIPVVFYYYENFY
jgi:hypothetical protein